jgi:hypothetical protein
MNGIVASRALTIVMVSELQASCRTYIDEIAAWTARISRQESSTSAEFSIVEGTPGWVPVEVNGHYRIVPEDFVFPV